MELKLNEQELDYLTMVIEQNLTEIKYQKHYREMLEDLYSKLKELY